MCSPVDAHLDFFQFGAVTGKATMNVNVQVFVWTCVFISPLQEWNCWALQ